LIQLAVLMAHPENVHQGNSGHSDGTAQLNFRNHGYNSLGKDSVLVICDRYDRSGAGIVFKVFHLTGENSISISDIPAGKYYLTIQCLGVHRDRIEKVVKIKSKKVETISIKLQDCDAFSKDEVVIPAERPDFANLKIMHMK
jgi:hypothetical protein